jgi:beta-lactam-binding protein with PASTA domain
MRQAATLALVVTGMLAFTACGSKNTIVPPVDTTDFGSGMALLQKAGLRAEVISFVPPPDGSGLEGVRIADQDPEPGTQVTRGSIVHLTIRSGPIPSPAIPIDHPTEVVVPNLVGLSWEQASTKLTGLWPQITSIDPLPADKGGRGLEPFYVRSQSPKPGTHVPYLGKPTRTGVDMKPSTIALEIGVR